MKTHYRVVVKVPYGLQVIDSCGSDRINHNRKMEVVLTSDPKNIQLQICTLLNLIHISAVNDTKQKIAEQCNSMLLFHSSYISRLLLNDATYRMKYNLNYPVLNISVTKE